MCFSGFSFKVIREEQRGNGYGRKEKRNCFKGTDKWLFKEALVFCLQVSRDIVKSEQAHSSIDYLLLWNIIMTCLKAGGRLRQMPIGNRLPYCEA